MSKWIKAGALASVCMVGSSSFASAAIVEDAQTFDECNALGMESISKHDFVAAEAYFKKAKEIATRENRLDLVQEMDARRAARYIHEGAPDRSVIILTPYIKTGVNKFMLADYLQALRTANKYDQVIAVYQQMPQDMQTVPTYGLQMVGDSYLRKQKFKEAADVYVEVLKKDTLEKAPYAQLGYAYCLAKLGKQEESLKEYAKIANKEERFNNVIVSDGDTFLADGRIHFARKLFALLEGEKYRLKYAQSLVSTSKDFQDDTLNFKRDEILSNRDYSHEANKLLNKLEKSENQDIAYKAKLARTANFMQQELYADADKRININEAKSNLDIQNMLGDKARTTFNSLSVFYENSIDNKRNREQSIGAEYETYLGNNTFLEAEAGHKWMQDDSEHKSFWLESVALAKKFEDFQIRAEVLGYQNIDTNLGYELSFNYDFNDVTKMSYAYGKRPHEHVAAVKSGIDEKYHSFMITHQLNHLTTLEGKYENAKLSDGNHYKGYDLSTTHLIRIRHNFSDKVRVYYSNSDYSFESDYDSPWYRVEYGLAWIRKWNLPDQDAVLEMQTSLAWGHDNDDRTGFVPSIGLTYVREFAKNQQLRIGAVYHRYFNQSADDSKRKDAYGFAVSYNWKW